jgi:hypothetical protein
VTITGEIGPFDKDFIKSYDVHFSIEFSHEQLAVAGKHKKPIKTYANFIYKKIRNE